MGPEVFPWKHEKGGRSGGKGHQMHQSDAVECSLVEPRLVGPPRPTRCGDLEPDPVWGEGEGEKGVREIRASLA